MDLNERLVLTLPPFLKSFKRIVESILKGDWRMPFEETRKHLLHVHILSFRMMAPDNQRYSEVGYFTMMQHYCIIGKLYLRAKLAGPTIGRDRDFCLAG